MVYQCAGLSLATGSCSWQFGFFTELQRLSVRFLSKFFVSLDNTGLRTWKGENPKSEGLIQCYLKWPLVC